MRVLPLWVNLDDTEGGTLEIRAEPVRTGYHFTKGGDKGMVAGGGRGGTEGGGAEKEGVEVRMGWT